MSGRVRLISSASLSAVFLVIFSGAAAIAGLSYPPTAATMPLLVGGIGAALCLLRLVGDLRASRDDPEEPIDLARDVPIYLWVWAFIIAIVAFGFLHAAAPMLLINLRLRVRE